MHSEFKTKIVVIGNGPSLRGFDFHSLGGVDTLGMNAAYRHWERIDWCPTHYCCLDDQLIETHAQAIFNLIKSEKVKTAFLIAKILDYYPDLLENPNIYYLESFHSARHKREAAKGIPFISSPFLRESDSSKVTTGAYSVRFAAHLGYREISILGIDLKYQERLPETATQGGTKLVMRETPTINPNYFFDDYQRAGDKYNVPNPDLHDRNLHVAAFEILANDCVQFHWNIKIINSNINSVLHANGLFPYMPIKSYLSTRRLSALVIPATPQEIELLEQNFLLWDSALLVPSTYSDLELKPDLVVAFSSNEDLNLTKRILDFLDKTVYIKNCFAKVDVIYIELHEAVDYYERDYTKVVGKFGYKAGPNEQFFRTINRLAHLEGFIFYMETDCVPLRQGWLDAIRVLAEGDNESWVIGSYYRGVAQISRRFKFHLNGNALYQVGSANFIKFVNDVWQPNLYSLIENSDPTLAYDCLVSDLFNSADPDSVNNPEWQIFQSIGHRFRGTSLIQNISASADRLLDSTSVIQQIFLDSPRTFLAHGCVFRDLVSKLLATSTSTNKFPRYWASLFDCDLNSKAAQITSATFDHISSYPRLLIIDKYPVDHLSATGQIKRTFMGDWPSSACLQIWENDDSLHSYQPGTSYNQSEKQVLSAAEAVRICIDFAPNVIYFRPVESLILFDFVSLLINQTSIPLVVHMMDDWPERMRIYNLSIYNLIDPLLRFVFARAAKKLSICQAMSAEYSHRYGHDWIPLSNGVDIAEYPALDRIYNRNFSADSPFVIRYMGALADDMGFQSICDVAHSVSRLHNVQHVCLEIYTMEWCIPKARKALGCLPGVSILSLVPREQYYQLISEADALVIAYNFDPASLVYARLSLANKLPECLASGSPIIGYGPTEFATISYLYDIGCAQLVTERSDDLIDSAISKLIDNPQLCHDLAQRARIYASTKLGKSLVQSKFKSLLLDSINLHDSISIPLVGPYPRESHASCDETQWIAELCKESRESGVMIDVGAHHGSALAPFLDYGWHIFAFEPDKKNRACLFERLKNSKFKENVSVDSSCVSNKSIQGIPFFTSEQSTGISELSAFHSTHKQSQTVDVTTLSVFLLDKELPSVDFLKIDSEGHDLFVLEGFPWDRAQPSIIECVFENSKTLPLGYEFHDLARFLVERQYTVFVSEWHPIIRYGISHDWCQLKRYPCELNSCDSWGNLLAFREPIDESLLQASVYKSLNVGSTQSLQKLVKPNLGSCIKQLALPAEAWGFSVQPSQAYVHTKLNTWRYTHSSGLTMFWIVSMKSPGALAGRAFAGTLRICADRAMEVDISLGRHDVTDYEGCSKLVLLEPGVEKVITLFHRFEQSHRSLKLQLNVISMPGSDSANISIDCIGMSETFQSVQDRLAPMHFNVAAANSLFNNKDYVTSLAIYLAMFGKLGLQMYAYNAVRSAKLMGMSWVDQSSDLCWIK